MDKTCMSVTKFVTPNPSEIPSGNLPGEFAQHRCAYSNCNNGRYTHRKKLFSFPSDKKGDRLEMWIKNSGNEKLRKLKVTTLRHRGLCEDHFHDSDFTSSAKTGLKKTAVPIKYRSPCDTMSVENATEETNVNSEDPLIKRLHIEEESRTLESHENFMEVNVKNKMNPIISLTTQPLQLKPRSQIDQKVYTALQDSYRFFEDIDDKLLIPLGTTEPRNESLDSASHQTLALKTKSYRDQATNTSFQDEFENVEGLLKEAPAALPTIPPLNSVSKPLLITVSKSYNDHIEEKVKSQKKEIAMLRKENRVLRRKLLKPLTDQVTRKRRSSKNPKVQLLKEDIENILDQMELTPVARTIISLQMHAQNLPYTQEQLDLTQKLYDVSPVAIKILRRNGVHFPGIDTIRRCNKKVNSPQDSESFLDYICLEQVNE